MNDEREQILKAMRPWCENRGRCLQWYHSHPLPSFSGRTAQQLVTEGRGESVMQYLRRIEVGGYA